MASDIGSNYDWLLYINNLAHTQKKDVFTSFLVELRGVEPRSEPRSHVLLLS